MVTKIVIGVLEKLMSEVNYLLFQADFDETESNLYELSLLSEIQEDYIDDEYLVKELITNGCLRMEWWEYRLVDLNKYKGKI